MKVVSAAIVLFIALNAVVLPNAQQGLLAGALILGFLVAFAYRQDFPLWVLVLVLVSYTITIFYCIVGFYGGASVVAIQQALIIYVASPILWVMVIDMAYQAFGVDRIVAAFSFLAILAAASVGLYYFLFLSFGPGAVAFFGSRANVHLEDNYAGTIMHVSGSLIFLGAAFFAEPTVVRSFFWRLIILLMILLAAASSGRTAAILGIAVGSLFLVLADPRRIFSRLIWSIPLFAVMIAGVYVGMDLLLGVDVFQAFERHYLKVIGGDVQRPAQITALVEGAEAHWFLGAGHGIGVDYIRSTDFPWRYEAVYFALLLKLGIVGTLVLLLPLILPFWPFLTRLVLGRTKKYDAFFGAALTAVLLAGVTNPYLEGFAFQWMFLLPAYHFLASTSTPAPNQAISPSRGQQLLSDAASLNR